VAHATRFDYCAPVQPVPRLRLKKDVVAAIRRGHPWIFAAALERPARELPAGAEVDVVAPQAQGGSFLARGFHDPDGPIAVRVLTRNETVRLDAAFVRERVLAACALRRASAHELDGDAVRLLNGEGDLVPGLVLDAYADTGVVRFDGAAAESAWAPHARTIAAALAEGGFPLARLWARPSEGRAGGGRALVGDAPAGLVMVREATSRFEVDVVHGQKTGLFLDQRPNRALVHRLAGGLRVLNLYSYTGGFSVAAALGGAKKVSTVDLAKPAIEAAKRNFSHSGLAPEAHEFAAADCRAYLSDAAARGRSWDLAICDPPSFAPSEKAKPAALAAYRGLNEQVARVVAPGGLLASASCSSHVTMDDFTAAIAGACADAGRRAQVVHAGGAGPDHPVSVAFPEGRYLKFLLLRVD
jgi:23S rRNA (cytosine1962-C5)-methyltransferase